VTKVTSTLTFEVEIDIEGSWQTYYPATRIDPAEGGCCEDVEVVGIGLIELDRSQRNPSHPNGTWRTRNLLDGIDRNDPAIQRLFQNILEMRGDEAMQELISEYDREAA
jgi:hypothetical protein